MGKNITFITGYFGAPTRDIAIREAETRGCPVFFLDEEIQKRDGRSIKRLVMMNGEHGYRNLEYELLVELTDSISEQAVIACGDGVLYDDDSRRIILSSDLIIAGEDMDLEALWRNALDETDTYHAFMHFGNQEEKYTAFIEFIERQKILFGGVK